MSTSGQVVGKGRVRCHQHSIAATHAAFCITTIILIIIIIIIIMDFLDRNKYDGRDLRER
jgi:hypothetical protein